MLIVTGKMKKYQQLVSFHNLTMHAVFLLNLNVLNVQYISVYENACNVYTYDNVIMKCILVSTHFSIVS